jgi:hypothetical protein
MAMRVHSSMEYALAEMVGGFMVDTKSWRIRFTNPQVYALAPQMPLYVLGMTGKLQVRL